MIKTSLTRLNFIMTDFILHNRLAQDSFFVADLQLCQIRLINNQDFIWFILVPKINDIVHLTDLSPSQQNILMQEINLTAGILQKLFQPSRLNIAALGNVVAQMHWHIVARYTTDIAWPNPVWGVPSSLYQDNKHNAIIDFFKYALSQET
jgi:diadenosine tetraphosphate (Ap4A) HIT family hydrolase